MFVLPSYLMDGPGPSIVVSGQHEEFSNHVLGIWIGKNNSDGCCRPVKIHKIWTGFSYNIA